MRFTSSIDPCSDELNYFEVNQIQTRMFTCRTDSSEAARSKKREVKYATCNQEMLVLVRVKLLQKNPNKTIATLGPPLLGTLCARAGSSNFLHTHQQSTKRIE